MNGVNGSLWLGERLEERLGDRLELSYDSDSDDIALPAGSTDEIEEQRAADFAQLSSERLANDIGRYAIQRGSRLVRDEYGEVDQVVADRFAAAVAAATRLIADAMEKERAAAAGSVSHLAWRGEK